MIQVNRAFFHFKKLFGKRSPAPRQVNNDTVHFANAHNTNMLTKHKDPGYAYYKQGFNLFSKIHPNSWHTPLKKEKFITTLKREETNDEMIKIVEELLEFLPRSYYYFSRVLEEYPESSWAYDAQEKMIKIEKLTPVYVRIVKSLKNEMREVT